MTYGPPGGWGPPAGPQPADSQPATTPQWPAPAPAQHTAPPSAAAPQWPTPAPQWPTPAPQWPAPAPSAPAGYYGGVPVPGQALPGRPASIGARVGAFFIDVVILSAAFVVTTAFIIGDLIDDARNCVDKATGTRDPNGAVVTVRTCKGLVDGVNNVTIIFSVLGLAVVAYYTVLVGLYGATLGKKALGLKVVDARTGARIGLVRGFIRYLVQSVSNFVCLAGLWSPMIDKSERHQGWHDKAANDIVVSTR